MYVGWHNPHDEIGSLLLLVIHPVTKVLGSSQKKKSLLATGALRARLFWLICE